MRERCDLGSVSDTAFPTMKISATNMLRMCPPTSKFERQLALESLRAFLVCIDAFKEPLPHPCSPLLTPPFATAPAANVRRCPPSTLPQAKTPACVTCGGKTPGPKTWRILIVFLSHLQVWIWVSRCFFRVLMQGGCAGDRLRVVIPA